MDIDKILYQPSEKLRSISNQRQFFMFMRLSTHLLTIFAAGIFVVFASELYDVQAERENVAFISHWSQPWFLVALATIVLVSISLTLCIELAPALNYEPRRGFGVALITTISVCPLAAICCFIAMSFLEPVGNSFSMFYAGVFCLSGLAWAVIPVLRGRWLLLLVLCGLIFVISKSAGFDQVSVLIVIPVVMYLGIVMTEWTLNVLRELERAKNAEAALQISEERLRIAQQLHDSMGQSLAAVSLKTQIVHKLLEREQLTNPVIYTEVEQLKQLLNHTSTHMRQVVHGYRSVSVASELAGAEALFTEAGIALQIVGEAQQLDTLAPTAQQTAAWFIREVSTNVLKHSCATWVRIRLAPERVEITNNGASEKLGTLSGLATLNTLAQRENATIQTQSAGTEFTTTLIFHVQERNGQETRGVLRETP